MTKIYVNGECVHDNSQREATDHAAELAKLLQLIRHGDGENLTVFYFKAIDKVLNNYREATK